MKFKELKEGDNFSLGSGKDVDSKLTYTKENDTDAQCDQASFGIVLNDDQLVWALP